MERMNESVGTRLGFDRSKLRIKSSYCMLQLVMLLGDLHPFQAVVRPYDSTKVDLVLFDVEASNFEA